MFDGSGSSLPLRPQHRMSRELLERVLDSFLYMCDPASTICFQGGEPMLMGLEFFEYAAEYVKRRAPEGKHLSFALQTNGILLNDKWCEFLKKEDWLVGLSIDGPADMHDTYRVDHGGRGAFSQVYRGMELLKKHEVSFNTLSVITKANAGRPEELFDFLVREGSGYMQFIPCLETGEDGQPADFVVTPEELGTFLCRAFDKWYDNDRSRYYVRFFDELLISYVSLQARGCECSPFCIAAPVIEHDGTVYPCDFFVEPERRLGDLSAPDWAPTDLLADLSKPSYTRFMESKQNFAAECATCKWRGLCGGDCKKHRIAFPDTGSTASSRGTEASGSLGLQEGAAAGSAAPDALSYFCEGYKAFYEYSHDAFLKMKRRVLASRNEEAQYYRRINASINRNDPCPCGSGLKYKKCCLPVKGI